MFYRSSGGDGGAKRTIRLRPSDRSANVALTLTVSVAVNATEARWTHPSRNMKCCVFLREFSDRESKEKTRSEDRRESCAVLHEGRLSCG